MRLSRFAIVLLYLVASPSVALAHSGLIASFPADGQIIDAEVSEIKMEFSKVVRVTRVSVKPAGGSSPVQPTTDLPQEFVETVELAVPPLEPGSYETRWTVVAQDGHVMNGAFSFTVAD